MEELKGRVALYEQVRAYFGQVQRLEKHRPCFFNVKENIQYEGLPVIKKLGKGGNVQGDAYKVCIEKNKKCLVDLALKLILPTVEDIEVKAMALVNVILLDLLCPNLPIMYLHQKCQNCKFSPDTMLVSKIGGFPPLDIHETKKPGYVKYKGEDIRCTTIVSEFASGGDMEHWLSSAQENSEELYNAFFQVFAGLYSIYTVYGMTHNDLHTGNVLVHKTNPGGVWEYVIDDEFYYCPNLGNMFVLWDFGFAIAPGLINIQEDYVQENGFMYGDPNVESADIFKFTSAVLYFLKKFKKDNKFPLEISAAREKDGKKDTADFIKKFYKKYKQLHADEEIIETYFLNKYQSPSFYKNLDVKTLRRLADKLEESRWAAIVVHRGLSVAELKEFEEHIDFSLLSKVVTDEHVVREFQKQLNWKDLSRWEELPEDLIADHADEVNWMLVSHYAKLSQPFMSSFADRLDWTFVVQYQEMSPGFMITFKDKIPWELTTDKHYKLWCTAMMVAMASYIPWNTLSLANRTDKSVASLAEYANWEIISGTRKMDWKFIEQFQDRLDKTRITLNPHTDLFLLAEKFPQLVEWEIISKPSEKFIEKYSANLNWSRVSGNISVKLIPKYENLIDWAALQEYNKLSEKILTEYIAHMDFEIISRTQDLTESFVKKYRKYIDFEHIKISSFSVRFVKSIASDINWVLDANAQYLLGNNLVESIDPDVFDWAAISRNIHLFPREISVLEKELDWEIVSPTMNDPEYIFRYKELIIPALLENYSKFKYADYVRLSDWLDWSGSVSRYGFPDKQLLHMFSLSVNLQKIPILEFDWEFIRQNKSTVNWSSIATLDLPPVFVREFWKELNLV